MTTKTKTDARAFNPANEARSAASQLKARIVAVGAEMVAALPAVRAKLEADLSWWAVEYAPYYQSAGASALFEAARSAGLAVPVDPATVAPVTRVAADSAATPKPTVAPKPTPTPKPVAAPQPVAAPTVDDDDAPPRPVPAGTGPVIDYRDAVARFEAWKPYSTKEIGQRPRAKWHPCCYCTRPVDYGFSPAPDVAGAFYLTGSKKGGDMVFRAAHVSCLTAAAGLESPRRLTLRPAKPVEAPAAPAPVATGGSELERALDKAAAAPGGIDPAALATMIAQAVAAALAGK
jgi:hypothetical protein